MAAVSNRTCVTVYNLSTADLDVVKALHCEHVIYSWVHPDLVNDCDSSLLRTVNIHPFIVYSVHWEVIKLDTVSQVIITYCSSDDCENH